MAGKRIGPCVVKRASVARRQDPNSVCSPPANNYGMMGEGGWEPFSTDVKLARLVPRGSLHQLAESQGSEASWPVKVITGWEPFSGRPHPEDHAGAGLSSNYDFQARTVRLEAGRVGVVGDLRN